MLSWKIPLVVDTVQTTVSGTLYLREQASVAWWLLGLAALLLAVVLSMARQRALLVALLGISVTGIVTGTIQFLGLPAEARITPILLLFSGAAAAIGSVAMFSGRTGGTARYTTMALQSGVGATCVVTAWLCFDQVRAAYVPGIETPWLVRGLVPIMLGVGVVAVIDGVTRLVRDTAVLSD